MGVTSASPQKARIRETLDLKRLIGGRETPCVRAAPRATVVQKPSTSFGVTRISSTGGKSATYSDQLLKSTSGRMNAGSATGVPAPLLPLAFSNWYWAP